MTSTNGPESAHIRRIIQDLRSAHILNKAYGELEAGFHLLLDQRRADMADGSAPKLYGLALIGHSGSGKTTAMRELIRRNSDIIRADPEEEICELISLQVPSPATMKFVGSATLHALCYPLARDKSASVIWDMVKQQLRFRRTLFLHYDEAQDLTRFQTENERRSVVSTLKSLMENSQWPAGLILSGMSELKTIINQDTQLVRRFEPVTIPRLHPLNDTDNVISFVRQYAGRAGIKADDLLTSEGFARRLMHAADYEFGLLAGGATRSPCSARGLPDPASSDC